MTHPGGCRKLVIHIALSSHFKFSEPHHILFDKKGPSFTCVVRYRSPIPLLFFCECQLLKHISHYLKFFYSVFRWSNSIGKFIFFKKFKMINDKIACFDKIFKKRFNFFIFLWIILIDLNSEISNSLKKYKI